MPEPLHIFCPDCLADNAIAPGAQEPVCSACGSRLMPAAAGVCLPAGLQPLLAGSGLPLLVYFFAAGCTPCTLMGPIVDRAAKKLRDRLCCARIDARQDHALAEACGVSSVPCAILFEGGWELKRFCGAMDLQSLISWIRER